MKWLIILFLKMFSKKLLDIIRNSPHAYEILRFPSLTVKDATFWNALDCSDFSVSTCHTHTYHTALHLFWRYLFASQTWKGDSVKLLLKFPAWPEWLWCTAAVIVPNAQTPRVTSGTGCFSFLIRLTETWLQTLKQGIFGSFASDLHIWHLLEGVSQSVRDNCQHAEREI